MSRATPRLREVAARLIAVEAGGAHASEPNLPAALHVCEKLRPHLATLMGKAGFCAVLSRAVAVSSAEAPWLAGVKVAADGSLAGWEKADAPVASSELIEGGELLVAQLLGLLVAFIGESLTLRFVREVWPNVSLEDRSLTQGDQP